MSKGFTLTCNHCGNKSILTQGNPLILFDGKERDYEYWNFDEKVSEELSISNCGYDGEIIIECLKCKNFVDDVNGESNE